MYVNLNISDTHLWWCLRG